MNSPHVLSFSANDATGKTARFTVGTDIIDYMESSRTFGREDLSDPNADGRFQRRMVAIPDKKGAVVTPMVLTISNKNDLYLVRKDDESKSGDGWKLIEVSSAFKGVLGDNLRVRAHAAGWTEDDRITIAVAVDDGSSERSRVFVAYDLSSRTSDWENISWIDCGSREDIRVEGIRVLDGGDGVWTIVLAGDRGPNDTLYLLRSNTQRSFAQALVFTTAVTLEEILDFEVAVHPLLGSGIAVLGTSVGKRDLSFRPFPSYKPDGSFDSIPPVEAFPCPAGANVLESGLTKQVQKGRRRTYFGTDIYVGGQGVHQIQAFDILQVGINGGTLDPIVVASPDIAPNVQDLIVGDVVDGTMSVWALLQNGDLNVVRKPAAAQEWGNPLRLRVGVQAIAPVHGDEHLTTSLLMVYANGDAAFLCRDEGQGVWQERPLAVANPEEVTKVTCYGTTLRVLGEGSIPKPEIKVKVSASVLSSVVLNGNAVFIGPGVSFETETDANGAVSLFDRVKSFTPAICRFEIDGFEQCIDVNPASGVHERFQSITADELKAATISTPEGEVPLLPENFRTGADSSQVDIVAASLNQVSTLANSSNGVVSGVSQVSADQAFSSTLRTEVVPDGYRWGIQADANGIRIIEGGAIDQVLDAIAPVWKPLKKFGEGIVDFFEGLTQSFKEGGLKGGLTFVLHKTKEAAKDVYEFVCAIGNEVKRFVLDSFEKVGSFFEWLWEQVKTGLEAVWEALKFVFDWKDILRVRDAMVDLTGDVFDYVESSIDTMKEEVASGIDSLVEQIETWRAETGEPPQKIQKASPGKSFLNTISQVTEPIQDVLDQVTGNSVVCWITDKANDLFSEIIEFDIPDTSPDLIESITDFFEETASDTIDELWNTFSQIREDVVNLFDGDFPDIGSMNFETVKQLLVSIGSETLQGFLNLSKNLMLNSLDLAKKLIAFLRSVLFTKIRFPFIEKLVKLVTKGSISIDTSFSLMEGIMLLLAVPTTIGYKIRYKDSPIKPGESLSFPYGAITIQAGTDENLKLSSRVFRLFSAFIKLIVSSFKLFWNKLYKKADFYIYDTPTSSKAKLPDVIALILGTLSFTGSILSLTATDFTEPLNSPAYISIIFCCDVVRWSVPSVAFPYLWYKSRRINKKEDLNVLENRISKICKIGVLAATSMQILPRTTQFALDATEFEDSKRKDSKILGYVSALLYGISTSVDCFAAYYTGEDEKSTKSSQLLLNRVSLILFAAPSSILALAEACL